MTREEAIKILAKMRERYRICGIFEAEALNMAIQALSQEPTSEMVHVETLHQVMWERDIAIGQLKELGYSFGQKIEPCDDAISRPTVVRFEGTNMACMGGDEIMKEFENNTQQHCNDRVISLERAKKQIGRWIGYIDQDMINRICISLEQLPSVTYKSGKWIDREVYDADRWKCSECGRTEPYKENYCPNCGAKMESEVNNG